MTTSISFNQLANIGVHAPLGATGFQTTEGSAIYVIGSTGKFVERELKADAADRLMKLYKIGGTLGWNITGAGHG